MSKLADIDKAGIARQLNPTATLDGVPIAASYDKLGRSITYPYQVRELLATANANLTRGLETTILAGVAGTFLDIIDITGINTSSNAIRVDIRTGTGGTVVYSMEIPATNTTIEDFKVPFPQSEAAQTWTGQVNAAGEISDSPVSISLLAIKNI